MSKKCLFLTASMFGIVIFAYYNADLTTNMTIAPSPLKINSFEDIANSDFMVRTWPNMLFYNMLATENPDSSRGKVFKKLEENRRFTDGYASCWFKCMANLLVVSVLLYLRLIRLSTNSP